MNFDELITKILRFSGIKVVKFFFQALETIICWYFYKINKKGKKINKKFFCLFQIFSDGRLYTFHRRKTYDIITNKINKNSEEDVKVFDLANKSYSKLFEINSSDSQKTVEYFHNQKIYDSHVPFNSDFPNKLITVNEFLNANDCHYGSFDIQTSLNSETIKKICNMTSLWNIVRKYLNSSKVNIYTINTMLTKKSEKKTDYVINMHKDQDCASSLTVFIYW